MRTGPYIGLAVGCCIVAAGAQGKVPAAGGADGMARYQVIIDRNPFGAVIEVAEGPAGPAPPPPAQPASWEREWRLCALTEHGTDARAGVVNIRTKEGLYLHVGEEDGGFLLVAIDYDRDGALLRRDGQDAWLYMDGGAGGGADVAEGSDAGSVRAGVAGAALAAARGASGPVPRAPSYAERLRRRNEILEERRRESAERQQWGPEVLKQQLQQYQMDLIRAGGELGPPLPIPLTKEMDEQLVAEGVLPPQK